MLRITAKNQFEAAGVFVFHNLIMIVAIVLSGFDLGVTVSLGLLAIADSAPTIYLHWEYYDLNKGLEFSIGRNAIQIRSISGDEKFVYSDEIENITIYMSANVEARTHIHFLSMGTYHFARVILKDERPDIVITNLVVPFVEKEVVRMEGVPIQKKIQPFNSVMKEVESVQRAA